AAKKRDLSTNPPDGGRFVDNPVDGPTPRLVRSHPALRRREGNAVHEGHGETRPRTGWIGEDRTIIARSARRVDAGSGAAPRGTPSQGRRAVGTQARAAPDARHGHPTPADGVRRCLARWTVRDPG